MPVVQGSSARRGGGVQGVSHPLGPLCVLSDSSLEWFTNWFIADGCELDYVAPLIAERDRRDKAKEVR